MVFKNRVFVETVKTKVGEVLQELRQSGNVVISNTRKEYNHGKVKPLYHTIRYAKKEKKRFFDMPKLVTERKIAVRSLATNVTEWTCAAWKKKISSASRISTCGSFVIFAVAFFSKNTAKLAVKCIENHLHDGNLEQVLLSANMTLRAKLESVVAFMVHLLPLWI